MERFYAHGKLLLSGEYAVLKGALALAMPTSLGQHLTYHKTHGPNLNWRSLEKNGALWLQVVFTPDFEITSTTDWPKATFLSQLLRSGHELAGKKFMPGLVETHIEFDRNWGLGSSSTLTHLIASWLGADPLALHRATQNGSGYDVACAGLQAPILYQNTQPPLIEEVKLPKVFDQVCFVHLGQKQLSQPEVNSFLKAHHPTDSLVQLSEISKHMLEVPTLKDLMELMHLHETILASLLNKATVQQRLFGDYVGAVKSLGAWGGDFVMVAGTNVAPYFKSKGYNTILSFRDLSL